MVVTLLVKSPVSPTLKACQTLLSNSHKRPNKSMIPSHWEAFYHLLEKDVTHNIIAYTDDNRKLSTQPLRKMVMGYAEAPSNKALRCEGVYDKYVPRVIYI